MDDDARALLSYEKAKEIGLSYGELLSDASHECY